MFWGTICHSGEERTSILDNSLCITTVALEPKRDLPDDKEVSLFVHYAGQKHLICTLEYGKLMQQVIKLKFKKDDALTFSVNGEGTLHILGYNWIDDLNEELNTSNENAAEIIDGVEEEDELGTHRCLGTNNYQGKSANSLELAVKSVLESDDSESEEDDEEWKPEIRHFDEIFRRSMVDDVDSPLTKLKKKKKVNFAEDSIIVPADDSYMLPQVDIDELEAEDEELDNDLSEGEEESEEESEEDEESDNEIKNESVDAESEEMVIESSKKRKAALNNNKSKKQKLEPDNKQADDMNSSIGRTPMPKKKKLSMIYVKPTTDGQSLSEAASEKSSKKSLNIVKKLTGGVESCDLKIGNGPVATKGKLIHIHYTGQFADGETFEKRLAPKKPFAFKLGKGEVIKGWDIGIEGMKVGGKRRLKIPPNMAYGKSGRDIVPPNSTLIFTLELKAVN